MKYYMLIFFTILLTNCCKDKGLGKIQDKSWFPFKSNSNIVYETRNGLIDSLSITNLDTSIQSKGEWGCIWRWENKECTLQSNKFTDFKIEMKLFSNDLDFLVYHSDKFINLSYKTDNYQPSNYPNQLDLIDSVSLNNTTYYKTLILTDSTNDFKVFYNRIGVLRYIFNKDTFDLKK